MTGIVLLDVAIGVFFALMIYSLAATTIQEAISGLLNLRGEMLRIGLYRLVTSERGAKVMLEAPIKALFGPGTKLTRSRIDGSTEQARLPSAIPPASFAKALLQALAKEYAALRQGKGSVDAAVAAMKTQVAGIELDQSLRDDIVAHLAKAQEAAGRLGTVEDALARAEERLEALGLPAETGDRVSAVLARIRNSTGTLKESVPAALQALQDGIGALDLEVELKRHLTGVIAHVEEAIDTARDELVSTVERLEAEIAQRFDTAMERVIGWYVRKTKLFLFGIGFTLALLTNFDVIGYAGDLVRDDDLRAKIVVRAQLMAEAGDLPAPKAQPTDFDEAVARLKSDVAGQLETLNRELGEQGVPLGWSCPITKNDKEGGGICVRGNLTLAGLLSWLIIGFACTMGGRFWYDALKKLMSARAAIAAPPPAKPAAGAAGN